MLSHSQPKCITAYSNYAVKRHHQRNDGDRSCPVPVIFLSLLLTLQLLSIQPALLYSQISGIALNLRTIIFLQSEENYLFLLMSNGYLSTLLPYVSLFFYKTFGCGLLFRAMGHRHGNRQVLLACRMCAAKRTAGFYCV